MFDKAFRRVNTFVSYKTEENPKKTEAEVIEGSSKRAGKVLQQESTKKQKVDDDDDEEELKQCFAIVPEEEVAINAIPLATKRAPEFDREDLENLWKVVKAKHGYTMPEEAYERVLWEDLKVMFNSQLEDAVWQNLLGQEIKL
ncbi:hypothetical protein Tco_0733515 [Tanacetum coccineum]